MSEPETTKNHSWQRAAQHQAGFSLCPWGHRATSSGWDWGGEDRGMQLSWETRWGASSVLPAGGHLPHWERVSLQQVMPSWRGRRKRTKPHPFPSTWSHATCTSALVGYVERQSSLPFPGDALTLSSLQNKTQFLSRVAPGQDLPCAIRPQRGQGSPAWGMMGSAQGCIPALGESSQSRDRAASQRTARGHDCP